MAEDPIKAVCHFAQALKAPRIRESAARLAEQARDGGWSHEEYLAAVLSREVAAREASGAAIRIRSAGFPTRKSLEDFNFDHQPALNRDMIADLGTSAFLTKARNVVFLGPPGTGKTHLAIGLAIKAAQAGHRIAFATAVDWVARLKAAHHAGRLPAELTKLRRIGLLVVDEVGLHPLRTRCRQPLLPAGLQPLRTRLADPDLEPALRPLGRRVRRPSRGRRHDRPHRASRRRLDPQRLQLPTQRHRNRHLALRQGRQHGTITTTTWPTFRPSPLA